MFNLNEKYTIGQLVEMIGTDAQKRAFEKNNKYYWFEHSWEICRGIHEYQNEDELLLDVKQKFIKYELNSTYDKDNLYIYKYNKPKYHITTQEFYSYITQGNTPLK